MWCLYSSSSTHSTHVYIVTKEARALNAWCCQFSMLTWSCWKSRRKKMLFVIWKAKALVLRNSGKLESRSEMNVWSGNETWLNIWKLRPPKHQKVFCKEAIFVWSLFGYIIQALRSKPLKNRIISMDIFLWWLHVCWQALSSFPWFLF